jgi:hypothetical protein
LRWHKPNLAGLDLGGLKGQKKRFGEEIPHQPATSRRAA